MVEELAAQLIEVGAGADDDDSEARAGKRDPGAVVVQEIAAGSQNGEMGAEGFLPGRDDEATAVSRIERVSEEVIEGRVVDPAPAGAAVEQR